MAIINYKKYELREPSARAAIIKEAKEQMSKNGAVQLTDFVDRVALDLMLIEALQKFVHAHRRDTQMGFNPKDKLAESSSSLKSRTSPYRMWSLGSDLLSDDKPIREMYCSAELIELVREILEVPELYITSDPLINVNLTYIGEGDQHGWHFDDNDFVVSLMLQQPEFGGQFEFVPNATELDEQDVSGILDGNSPLVLSETVKAGTLMLFRGRKALHRVAPVKGNKLRVIALLSFHTKPGFVYNDSVRMNALARTAPIVSIA